MCVLVFHAVTIWNLRHTTYKPSDKRSKEVIHVEPWELSKFKNFAAIFKSEIFFASSSLIDRSIRTTELFVYRICSQAKRNKRKVGVQ